MTDEVVKEETPNTKPVEVPSITAGDLRTMVNIIDAGSQRGAWKGEELSLIGNLRTKLVAIIQAVAPAPEATENEAVDETAE